MLARGMAPVKVKWMWGDNFSLHRGVTWWRAGSRWLEFHELKAALESERPENRQREVRMKVCWGESEQELEPVKLEEAWEYLVGEVAKGVNDTSATICNACKLSEHDCFKLKLLGRLYQAAQWFLVEADGRPELWREAKLVNEVEQVVTDIIRDHPVTSCQAELTDEAVELYGLPGTGVADVLAVHVEAGLLVIKDEMDERRLVMQSEAGSLPREGCFILFPKDDMSFALRKCKVYPLPSGGVEKFAVKLMHPENRRQGFQYLHLARDAYNASLDPNRYWVLDWKNFRVLARSERKGQVLELWLAFRGTSNVVEAG